MVLVNMLSMANFSGSTLRTHQECVEESFIPTMRTLFNAPATSPLSEVDTNNVAELFVELTRSSAETPVYTHQNPLPNNSGVVLQGAECVTERSLLSLPGFQAVSVHDSLAVRVCNEILRDSSAPEVRLFCKTLSTLGITTDPGPTNTDLQQLLASILQVALAPHTHTLRL